MAMELSVPRLSTVPLSPTGGSGKASARLGTPNAASGGGGGGSATSGALASSRSSTGVRASSASGKTKPLNDNLSLPSVAALDPAALLSAGVPLTAKSRALAEAKQQQMAAELQAKLSREAQERTQPGLPHKLMDEPNVDRAPPPDVRQRQLIFDSLQKIQTATPLPADKAFRKANQGNRGGTYLFTWGAGFVGQLARKLQRGQKKSSALPLAIPLNVIVRQLSCGALHTAVVTESGFVYTWGDAKYGKLGQSKEVLEHDTKTPQLVESLSRHFITQIACGRHHTVAVTDTGSIWSWGWGKSGQLGHGGRYDQPLPVKIDDDFMAAHGGGGAAFIAAGDKHTVYISRDGSQAYSFGCGEHGQTGHGKPDNKFEPTLIEALADKKISSIACGPIHTGFVTKEGAVYMCGFGEYFYSSATTTAGTGAASPRDTEPQTVLSQTMKRAASRGLDPALAGTTASADGDGEAGGLDGDSKHPVMLLSSPAPAGGEGKTQPLTPGGSNAGSPNRLGATAGLNLAATSASGGAGAGAAGGGALSPKQRNKTMTGAMHLQLHSSSASNTHTHFAYLPRHIVFPSDAAPISQIACGQSHNLALSQSGQVYSWGAGDYGQLGHGIRWSVNTPRLVCDSNSIHLKSGADEPNKPSMSIACVAAGRYHSFALTNAGILYGWGCNENGQLGIGSEPEKKSSDAEDHVLLPTAVSSILGAVVGQVTCGEHHTAVLTSARWMKLSPDVVFWKSQDDIERDLKQRIAVKSHRPLSKKDLARIQDDLKEWRDNHNKQKDEARKRETEDLKAQVNAISFKELDLSQSVKKQISLPSVAPGDDLKGDAPGTPSKRRQSVTALATVGGTPGGLNASPSATRLPRVGSRNEHKDEVAALGASKGRGRGAAGSPHRGMAGDDDAASVQGSQMSGVSPSQRSFRSKVSVMPAVNGGSEFSFYQGAAQGGDAAETGRQSLGGLSMSGAAPISRSTYLKETAGMVKRMTNQVAGHGEVATSQQLQAKMKEVFQLRETYDKEKHRANRLEEQLYTMRAEHGLSVHSNSASSVSKYQADRERVLTERLDELTMRLNTVMIKISESEENKNMYLKNIDHLKEETFERMTELTQLRKQAAEADAFYRKFADLHQGAMQERDKVVSELKDFESEIHGYRRFVEKQTGQYQEVVQIVQGVHRKQAKDSADRDEMEQTKALVRAERKQRSDAIKEEDSKKNAAKWSEVEASLQAFEEKMSKIQHATGLTDTDAIVNKFVFKGEVKQQLQAEIDEKQDKLAALTKQYAELQRELAAIKGDHTESSWRQVETLAEQSREAEQRVLLKQHEWERLTQYLTHVQEGLVALLKEYFGVGISVDKSVAAAAVAEAEKNAATALVPADGSAAGAGAGAKPQAHLSEREVEAQHTRQIAQLLREREGKHLWTEEQSELVFAYISAGSDQLKEQLAALAATEAEAAKRRQEMAEAAAKAEADAANERKTKTDASGALKALALVAGAAAVPAPRPAKSGPRAAAEPSPTRSRQSFFQKSSADSPARALLPGAGASAGVAGSPGDKSLAAAPVAEEPAAAAAPAPAAAAAPAHARNASTASTSSQSAAPAPAAAVAPAPAAAPAAAAGAAPAAEVAAAK